MNDVLVVGIDNGLDGGLCALSAWNSELLVDYTAMPLRKGSTMREIDPVALVGWIHDLHSPVIVALEEAPKHAASSSAMRSMAITYGQILGACAVRGLDVRRIQVPTWQSNMLGKRGSFSCSTKEQALKVARSLWPDESWLASERSKVPHDGIVDAALIARHFIGLMKR